VQGTERKTRGVKKPRGKINQAADEQVHRRLFFDHASWRPPAQLQDDSVRQATVPKKGSTNFTNLRKYSFILRANPLPGGPTRLPYEGISFEHPGQ